MMVYVFLKVLLCVSDFSSSVMETSLYARLNMNQVVGLGMKCVVFLYIEISNLPSSFLLSRVSMKL